MFGRGKPTDFDGESLARRVGAIETREDFSQFAQLLTQNYKKRRGEWENDKLDRYLEAHRSLANGVVAAGGAEHRVQIVFESK